MNKVEELYEKIEADPDLQGISIAGGKFKVRCTKNGLVTSLDPFILDTADWETVRSILVGEREPDVLRHMTRIVGYYSMTKNWSSSKIGELKDRIRGNYSFGDISDSTSKEGRLRVVETY